MKKINVIILLLMLTLFTPLCVKADMGMPMSSYKVRVNSQEGAPIYGWNDKTNDYEKTNKVLEYDTILTVAYEEIRNNILYGHSYSDDDGSNNIIKLSDVTPIEVNLQDHEQETTEKYYVFDDTCYLYKGPSKIYGKVSKEPKLNVGSIIESKYYDDMWIYVEQNGVKGWVYKYSYSGLSPYNEAAGMTNVEVYESTRIKTIKKVTMYKSPKTEEKLGLTIPSDTELEIIYSYSKDRTKEYYYVKYNDKYGWIRRDEETSATGEGNVTSNLIHYEEETLDVENRNGVILYASLNSVKDKITTIPKGTKITAYYYAYGSRWKWYQVEYNGKTGWINGFDLVDFNYDEEENKPNPEMPNNPIDNDKEPEKLPINTVIFYCVSTAIIISLTALVTTILINKKQKRKNKDKEKV